MTFLLIHFHAYDVTDVVVCRLVSVRRVFQQLAEMTLYVVHVFRDTLATNVTGQ